MGFNTGSHFLHMWLNQNVILQRGLQWCLCFLGHQRQGVDIDFIFLLLNLCMVSVYGSPQEASPLTPCLTVPCLWLVCAGNPVTDQFYAARDISVPEPSEGTLAPSSLACGFPPNSLLIRPKASTKKKILYIYRSITTDVVAKTGHTNGRMTCGDSGHHLKPLFKDKVNENKLYILIQRLD